MAISTYDIGDRIRLVGTFRDVDNALADPTGITLKVKDPSGNITSLTYATAAVTKDSTGVYYADIDLDESGTWWYRYEGTGDVKAAEENAFNVRESRF